MYPKLSSAWPKCAAVALALSFAASSAAARPSGIESAGCEGCHAGGPAPDVALAIDPASFGPGDSVTLTVTIAASNVNVGGFYLRASNGYLSAISAAGTKLVSPLEMTHGSPRAASQGSVSFRARWTAPDAPGGAYFQVWALAANGDGRTSGDGAGDATLTRAFGCERGTLFHADFDGDGYASANSVAIESCSQPAGFSATLGDCDDNDELIHPGATERCNQRDDNCNQQTDEGIEEPRNVYLDSDGDGYGVASSFKAMTGCSQLAGYSARAGDCDDHDSKVHPGATEVCNGRDDNCDGRVDELVRPVCGVGMCQRAANSCEPSDCIPGSPTTEICNFADDDCNGAIDDVPAGCAAAASGAGGATGASGAGGATGASGADGGNGLGGRSANGGTSSVAGSSTPETQAPSETGCSLRPWHSSASPRWRVPAGALGLACVLLQRRASQRRRKHVSSAQRSKVRKSAHRSPLQKDSAARRPY